MLRTSYSMAGLMLAASLFGCGKAEPKPVSVTGTVLYKEKPLCPANIYFQPQGPEGKQAYSPLQQDGTFTMKTMEAGDGVVPGKYKVTISMGFGNPRDLAGYDEKDGSPIEIEVPAAGLKDLMISLPWVKK